VPVNTNFIQGPPVGPIKYWRAVDHQLETTTKEFVDDEVIQPKKAKKAGLTLSDLARVATENANERRKVTNHPRLQFTDDDGLGIVHSQKEFEATTELQAATALVNLNKKSKKRKREIHVHVHLH
jgi:hypothetical protein